MKPRIPGVTTRLGVGSLARTCPWSRSRSTSRVRCRTVGIGDETAKACHPIERDAVGNVYN
jgi:hypothetical protein